MCSSQMWRVEVVEKLTNLGKCKHEQIMKFADLMIFEICQLSDLLGCLFYVCSMLLSLCEL